MSEKWRRVQATPEEQAAMREIYPDGLPANSINAMVAAQQDQVARIADIVKEALNESDDVGRCPDCDRWLDLYCAVDGSQQWTWLENKIAEVVADALDAYREQGTVRER